MGVLEALLEAYLCLLEMNCERGVEGRKVLVEAFGREIVELGDWAGALVEVVGEAEGDEKQVKVLAAAVAVRVGNIVQEFRARMIGVGEGDLW